MVSTSHPLLTLLRGEGPQSPATLMSRLGMSQPTLFRMVKGSPGEILALGAARNRKLAALRNVRGLGAEFPVFSVSGEGEFIHFGDLFSFYPSSFAFVLRESPSKPLFYPGLPFFLDDIRPQGFLGRAFTHKYPELRLPPRIFDWSNDDILEAIARRGEDLTGNILVGTQSFERFLELTRNKPEIIELSKAQNHYPRYAQLALDGDSVGSSAGGEYPKFCAIGISRDQTLKRVLVKFSPVGTTFAARRWRDLLICECLALQTLKEHRIDAAVGRIVEAEGRTFLETIRFDRIGIHGRKGVVSLAALQNEWIGSTENWAISGVLLEKAKKISSEDAKTIRRIECFGRLIANSDRHPGNLSFYWEPEGSQVRLAPVYDMLPMLYAPSAEGEDPGRPFVLPTFDHTLLEIWKNSLQMAIQYWEKVSSDSRISSEFRKTAAQNRNLLRKN